MKQYVNNNFFIKFGVVSKLDFLIINHKFFKEMQTKLC